MTVEKHLSPGEAELYRRTDEVLHYLWDPIGVAGVPEARDEYDSYVPPVFSMLQQGLANDEISEYLISIECDSMGLATSELSRKSARDVVDTLIAYKEWIAEKSGLRGELT
jgi:hypothetical protein